MSNINFDNPFLLIIGVLLLIITVIPFVISIRKENKTVNNTISFGIHIFISIAIGLAMAKTTYEMVITETNVYVLADVSYSSNNNLDLIDEYIDDLKSNVPKNSKIGVVCFGKDYELLVPMGEEIISVSKSLVDVSATNIYDALEYTASLFNDDVIKRIVIISDGKETSASNIASLVQQLSVDNIYIDAIYLNNNISEDICEVQVNQIEYVKSTYVNTKEKVYSIIQSNTKTRGYVNLYCDDVLYSQKAVTFDKGFNSVSFNLNTEVAGIHKYKLEVSVDGDTSVYNNSNSFVQEVSQKVKMLFVSEVSSDKDAALNLYGEYADIDFYINDYDVPYTVEALSIYDEFVLSNIDVRNIRNHSNFVSSLDILVSEFGKSLITLGNTYIQNNYDDETLASLSNMLPVKYGNNEKEEKLVTLVLDISRSMEQLDKLKMTKEAACSILDNLDDDVMVMVIAFFGEVGTVFNPTKALERESLKNQIRSLEAYQGTFMGSALDYTYRFITSLPYVKNEVILISDGLPYGEQENAAKAYVNKMALANIQLSTIHVVTASGQTLMKELASIGRGYYYYLDSLDDVDALILNQVLNSLTEVILEQNESIVNIELDKNELVNGVDVLPNVKGLYNNQAKTGVDVILSATYKDITGYDYIIPLYSSWEYGNGSVSSFASSISGDWISNWDNDDNAKKVLMRFATTNQPDERISSAFIVNTELLGTTTKITVKAPTLSHDSILMLNVTNPDGTTFSKQMVFDSENYITEINTEMIGEYSLFLSYELGNLEYNTIETYIISYSKEYDSFSVYEASNLYYMVSMNGKISEDGSLKLENDNSIVLKYVYDFTPLLMILSVGLYIIDIMVRKLRLADIKSLFKFFRKGVKK